MSHASVADMLNRVRQPFNVSVVGLAGAAAALEDTDHVAAAVKVAVSERARVAARIRKIRHLGLTLSRQLSDVACW